MRSVHNATRWQVNQANRRLHTPYSDPALEDYWQQQQRIQEFNILSESQSPSQEHITYRGGGEISPHRQDPPPPQHDPPRRQLPRNRRSVWEKDGYICWNPNSGVTVNEIIDFAPGLSPKHRQWLRDHPDIIANERIGGLYEIARYDANKKGLKDDEWYKFVEDRMYSQKSERILTPEEFQEIWGTDKASFEEKYSHPEGYSETPSNRSPQISNLKIAILAFVALIATVLFWYLLIAFIH
jgi:hypothetical protein